MKYEIMDIIEDFTEFVKRINENNHREKLEHIRTDEKRDVVNFSLFVEKTRMQSNKGQYSEEVECATGRTSVRPVYFLRELQKFFEFFYIWECLL